MRRPQDPRGAPSSGRAHRGCSRRGLRTRGCPQRPPAARSPVGSGGRMGWGSREATHAEDGRGPAGPDRGRHRRPVRCVRPLVPAARLGRTTRGPRTARSGGSGGARRPAGWTERPCAGLGGEGPAVWGARQPPRAGRARAPAAAHVAARIVPFSRRRRRRFPLCGSFVPSRHLTFPEFSRRDSLAREDGLAAFRKALWGPAGRTVSS